jgi:protein SCO1/2
LCGAARRPPVSGFRWPRPRSWRSFPGEQDPVMSDSNEPAAPAVPEPEAEARRWANDDPEAPWNQAPPFIQFMRKYIWFIGAGVLILMVTLTRPFLINRPEAPPVLAEVPAFTLTTHDGADFGKADMEGKVWVVGFVFTRCKTSCPVISQAMTQFHKELVDSRITEHVNMMTVTVDPEHDTPEILGTYARDLGVEGDDWVFLTGDSAQVESFVVDGFKLAVGDKEVNEAGAIDIAHSSRLVLVDRYGGIRGFYGIDEESRFELYHRVIATMRAEEGEPTLTDLSSKQMSEFGGRPE